jgi:hypothetical protein
VARGNFLLLLAFQLLLARSSCLLAAVTPQALLSHPLGALSGSVRTAGAKLPEDLAIEVRSKATGSRGAWSAGARFACFMTDHRFTCPIPVGEGDARLVSPGFAPFYLWNLKVRPLEAVDLSEILFHPGSSLSGWIQLADRSSPLDKVSIDLKPEVVGWQGDPSERKRTELRQHRTVADRNGFFQLAGLSPGEYVLTAQSKQLSPATVQLTIPEGRETALTEPLRLEPLSKLQVWLSPPTQRNGAPWQIELFSLVPRTNVYESVARSATTLDGSWVRQTLAGRDL